MKSAERQTRSHLMRLFEQQGLHPRHYLGQNFLIDLNLLEYIVEQADISRKDVVLEVGAGTASLTTYLASRAAHVVAVEVDQAMYEIAKKLVADSEFITLLHTDALKNKNRINPLVIDAVEAALSGEPTTGYRLPATGAEKTSGTGSASVDAAGSDAELQKLQIENCKLKIANRDPDANPQSGPASDSAGEKTTDHGLQTTAEESVGGTGSASVDVADTSLAEGHPLARASGSGAESESICNLQFSIDNLQSPDSNDAETATKHERTLARASGSNPQSEIRNPKFVRSLKLVANLPYQVATPVISNLVASELPWTAMVVTIQWELAERMTAEARRGQYGALSVWLQAQCDVEILKRLPPSVFWPRPKVDSAIVRLLPNAAARQRLGDREFFHDYIRRLFQQRRKFLRGVLISMYRKQLERTDIDAILEELGHGAESRAEQMGPDAHVTLANRIQAAIAVRAAADGEN